MSDKFINETGYEFTDISTEASRTYRFPDNEYVTLNEPLKLHVSKSGGHRVFTSDGKGHYVPAGWIHLKWAPKEGQASFVK